MTAPSSEGGDAGTSVLRADGSLRADIDGPVTPSSDAVDSSPSPPILITHFGLTEGDVRFGIISGGLILLLMLAHWGKHVVRGRDLVEIDRLPSRAYEFRIDMNSATWVEWMQLDGIGEVLARRIVADREENGAFKNIDDLLRVSGIGRKTLEKLRPHLECRDCLQPSDNSP